MRSDPRTWKPKVDVHFSVIEGRNPYIKMHKNLGQAKNAVGIAWSYPHVRGGQIWKLTPEGEDNILLFDVPKGTRKDDLPWRQ